MSISKTQHLLRFINAPNSSSYFLSIALILCVADMLQFAAMCMVAI